jgi:hypothetical protein
MLTQVLNETMTRERVREALSDERVRREYVRRKQVLRRRQRRAEMARHALLSLSL